MINQEMPGASAEALEEKKTIEKFEKVSRYLELKKKQEELKNKYKLDGYDDDESEEYYEAEKKIDEENNPIESELGEIEMGGEKESPTSWEDLYIFGSNSVAEISFNNEGNNPDGIKIFPNNKAIYMRREANWDVDDVEYRVVEANEAQIIINEAINEYNEKINKLKNKKEELEKAVEDISMRKNKNE